MVQSNAKRDNTLIRLKIFNFLGKFFGICGISMFFVDMQEWYSKFKSEVLVNEVLTNKILFNQVLPMILAIVFTGIFMSLFIPRERKIKINSKNLRNKNVINIFKKIKSKSATEIRRHRIAVIITMILEFAIFIGYLYITIRLIVYLETTKTVLKLICAIGVYVLFCCVIVNQIKLYERKKEEFTKIYQTKVVVPVLNYIDNNLTFISDKENYGISEMNSKLIQEIYEKAELGNEPYTHFFVDDLILSPTEDFKIYEINLTRKTIDMIGSRRGRIKYIYVSWFKGLFAEMSIDKTFEGVIKIKRKIITRANKKYILNDGTTKFEKYFYVISNNKVDSSQIVNDFFMESLAKIYEKYNMDFEITFKKGKVYVRVTTGEMFETKLIGCSVNIKDVAKCYCSISIISEIKKLINEI